jgi:hypothetical protein
MRYFLLLFGFGIAACNTAPSPIAANAADSTDLSSAAATADLAAQFAAKKGKYANDLGVLDEKTELNKRIKTLLGDDYGDFAERMAVQTPIRQDGTTWFCSSCASGACTFDEAAIAYDTATKNLFVCILKEGKPSVKSEQAAPNPAILDAYLKELL